MGQFKKPEVRAAILQSATRLFSRKGYTGTTLAEIARGADISTANLYVYFGSKLEIVYAIYDPWIRRRLSTLEKNMAALGDPRDKVRLLLRTMWRDLPAAKNGFVNNIMQAISSVTPRDRYNPTTVRWIEEQLERLLRAALPPARRKALSHARLALLMVMTYDGFIISRHVDPKASLDDATLEAVCDMFLGES